MRPASLLRVLVTASAAVSGGREAYAQRTKPWDFFTDALSSSNCDLINAANAEFVVLSDTDEMVIVSGADIVLEDLTLDANNFVFFEGLPAGTVQYATDGDGFRTVWWTDLSGRVVEVDTFTGEPFSTNQSPSDFVDVPCDACDFWDDPADCEDDGTPPVTPPIVLNLCGLNTTLGMVLTLMGLTSMRLVRARRR